MILKSTIEFTVDMPVYPERFYRAWLDSFEHAQFTGQPAKIQAQTGGVFSTLNGKVESRIRLLVAHSLIEQSWKVEGLPLDEDSRISLTIQPTCMGCEVRLRHSGVPVTLNKVLLSWWEEQYFRPMRTYFEAIVGDYVADMGDG
uniref:Activator of Hsp90 ATPase homologue 1/2-like C-terminal domain-containing protein n=2 Tax=Bellilinea TaxID=475960 RepID=A0A7C4L0U5_9CHLR